jgi:hypothetical protein
VLHGWCAARRDPGSIPPAQASKFGYDIFMSKPFAIQVIVSLQ